MDANIFKQQYADMVRQYLQDISFQILPVTTYDQLIEKAVVHFFQTRGSDPTSIDHMKPIIEAAAWISTSTYRFVPTNVRETIAVLDDYFREQAHDARHG
ncbi:hypothetical protein HRG_006891 [Hirsutella rhossiliensis]|uniref:Uncharacterized protein n=1 Tax=Hirsutella rhossiliensis TaxID=111463 RepID=A0A9P8MX14_9HYPO|nr:uncharacterized protein HRG_06891 [Hirsutella rhossiliensis]KAH0961811.1 hypothetical protein HRG_06891 [Hirsutella rhossiliensis]